MSTPTFNLALVRSLAFLSVLPYALAATKSSSTKSSSKKISSIKLPKTKTKATKGMRMGKLSKGGAIAVIVVIVVVVLVIAVVAIFLIIRRQRTINQWKVESAYSAKPESEVENKQHYDPSDTAKDYHEALAAPSGPPPAPAPQGGAADYYTGK